MGVEARGPEQGPTPLSVARAGYEAILADRNSSSVIVGFVHLENELRRASTPDHQFYPEVLFALGRGFEVAKSIEGDDGSTVNALSGVAVRLQDELQQKMSGLDSSRSAQTRINTLPTSGAKGGTKPSEKIPKENPS